MLINIGQQFFGFFQPVAIQELALAMFISEHILTMNVLTDFLLFFIHRQIDRLEAGNKLPILQIAHKDDTVLCYIGFRIGSLVKTAIKMMKRGYVLIDPASQLLVIDSKSFHCSFFKMISTAIFMCIWQSHYPHLYFLPRQTKRPPVLRD